MELGALGVDRGPLGLGLNALGVESAVHPSIAHLELRGCLGSRYHILREGLKSLSDMTTYSRHSNILIFLTECGVTSRPETKGGALVSWRHDHVF